jgi:hypothetical protein
VLRLDEVEPTRDTRLARLDDIRRSRLRHPIDGLGTPVDRSTSPRAVRRMRS